MHTIINWLFKSRIEEQQATARAIQVLDEAQRTRLQIMIQEGN